MKDLVVIDTIHGFRYPLIDQGVDDILLLPRACILENQPKQDAVQAALDALQLSTKKSLFRGKKRIVSFQSPGSMYLTPGAFPRRNGHGFQVRGLKDISLSHWLSIYKYVTNCEKKAADFMGTGFLQGFHMARETVNFPTFPSPTCSKQSKMFASIASAKNVTLNSHTDNDTIYSLVTPMEANGAPFTDNDDICLYFTFPDLGYSIALRPGDILIFNPQKYHSVSSRCDPTKPIWCTSLYLKNAVVGGNNNKMEFDTIEKRAMEILDYILEGGTALGHWFSFKSLPLVSDADSTLFPNHDNPNIL